MEKVTIKDIARLSGVSVATVSYVINGKHEDRYTADTKRKILQIVNLYNFQPSRIAQSFALSKSNNVILLTEKHETVLQKAESYDALRHISKAFESLGYNLIIRTHLENTRIDMADAVICMGLEENEFLRLAHENYVPLLSVDGIIHDELFFQVLQDFDYVVARGEEKFGKNNFTLALVDLYNQAVKDELKNLPCEVVYIRDSEFRNLAGRNIVTVNNSLHKLYGENNDNILLVPAHTESKANALIDCFYKATERVQGITHTVRVR
ncbi:MAG: LacI family transcriptional regulator [Clostridia bacterium]|jgi:transcriptional regulator with XRE-family HTH domain|nr:LacI family transcriptional regulator [Clostridia bacterium]